MIFLLNFVPYFCPSCGTSTGFDNITNPDLDTFNRYHAITCPICQTIFQKADEVDLLRAATASGGDLLEYFMSRDIGDAKSGNGKPQF